MPQEEVTKQGFQPIPDGTYTLQVTGAASSQFNPGAISITTAVADEGSEYRGRKVFVDIPDPDKQTWAAPVMARMFSAMGVTPEPYTNPIDTLNTLANNGHSRFKASVFTENYTKKNGEAGSKNKISYRSIAPAV